MNITNTYCKLKNLTLNQIETLQGLMPTSNLFDLDSTDNIIGFRCDGMAGTFTYDSGDSLISYKEMMQLLKPKWTIYNNTLPWSDLSDKQKGKMLLAAHGGMMIRIGDSGSLRNPGFNNNYAIYKAIKSEPVKPEPTMAELFKGDWYDCLANGGNKYEQMIAKGWVKK